MKKALLIVDVQNDFCPGGSLGVPDGDAVVPIINRYIERFSQDGDLVIASRDWHPLVTRHFKEYGGIWPPHCVQGTPGAEFHSDLELPEHVIVVSKGMSPDADSYSAFEAEDARNRPLANLLREHGVKRLYVGGLATDYCVKSSVLDALKEGFDVEFLTDAMRGVELQPGDSDKALAEMQHAGARPATLGSMK